MSFLPISERARGRWQEILPQLGVPTKALSGLHGPCPIERDGKDRFRFLDTDGAGTWVCTHCGGGAGVELAMRVNGWDGAEAGRRIMAILGDLPRERPKQIARPARDYRKALNDLWQASRPITEESPAGQWLSARVGLRGPYPADLRCCPRCWYRDRPTDDEPEPPVQHWPAMVAMVRDVTGRAVTLHRTYLNADGDEKAPVRAPRRLMPGELPKGAGIRLADVAPVLGIAEGIETALSATALFGVPCWAAINASMLEAWDPPGETESVVIFGDNDAHFAGQAAAFDLAKRLSGKVKVKIELPQHEGEDWNDELLRRHGMKPIGVRARHGIEEHAA